MSQGSIGSRVEAIVNKVVEQHSEQWLLALNYGQCNDFADSVIGLFKLEYGGETPRFETVARTIRAYKAKLRRTEPATTEVAYGPC